MENSAEAVEHCGAGWLRADCARQGAIKSSSVVAVVYRHMENAPGIFENIATAHQSVEPRVRGVKVGSQKLETHEAREGENASRGRLSRGVWRDKYQNPC